MDALVVDNLATDGVLGLDFLWHFAFEPSDNGYALRPLDDKPL
jgi:hypothetical protein